MSRNSKLVQGCVTRVELGSLLENFKTDTLNTISDQLDTLKIKRKQEEEKAALFVLCPNYKRKHAEKECPINVVEVCRICTHEHPTEQCPSLPGSQAIYKEGVETS